MSKFNPRLKAAFHDNATPDGRQLDPQERLKAFKNILPQAPMTNGAGSNGTASSSHRKHHHSNGTSLQSAGDSSATSTTTTKNSNNSKLQPRKKPIRSFTAARVHLLIYTLIHFLFGIYLRARKAYHALSDRVLGVLYYHHRTAELIRKDVQKLDRLPGHLSVVLSYQPQGDDGEAAALEALVNEVGEVAAWCSAAQIPVLSVYERTGILKSYLPQTHRVITRSLHAYFGPPPARPTLSLRAPQAPSFSPPQSPLSPFPGPDPFNLTVILISEEDGRSTMVDLTKTLAEMAQKGKLAAADVSKDLVDAEIQEGVMEEPELLVLFGDRAVLDGYPPWQIRLTEIFHVQDNTQGVGYETFLRALHRYAKAQMRFGR